MVRLEHFLYFNHQFHKYNELMLNRLKQVI